MASSTVSKGKKDAWIQIAKRNSVVAAVVLFVCVAVYLNWSYQKENRADVGKTLGGAALVDSEVKDPLVDQQIMQPQPDEPVQPSAGDYFASARLNRQQARDSALSLLQDASSGNATQTVIDQANAAIQTMANSTVTEAQIENLVTAKGYQDCVAFIGEDSISVVVQTKGGLTDVDTARIMDIVTQTTSFVPSQIRIIEVN